MADQFSKETIFNKFKDKARAKGFELNPDRSKMSKNIPIMIDLLEAIAEALSDILYKDENLPGTIKAQSLKIGPSGLQKATAYKDGSVKADMTTDPTFFTWIETFHSLLQAVYPEPGNGAPDVFAMALKSLTGLKPSSITAKITNGSGSVKVSI
jgi:hypothetical protein